MHEEPNNQNKVTEEIHQVKNDGIKSMMTQIWFNLNRYGITLVFLGTTENRHQILTSEVALMLSQDCKAPIIVLDSWKLG